MTGFFICMPFIWHWFCFINLFKYEFLNSALILCCQLDAISNDLIVSVEVANDSHLPLQVTVVWTKVGILGLFSDLKLDGIQISG